MISRPDPSPRSTALQARDRVFRHVTLSVGSRLVTRIGPYASVFIIYFSGWAINARLLGMHWATNQSNLSSLLPECPLIAFIADGLLNIVSVIVSLSVSLNHRYQQPGLQRRSFTYPHTSGSRLIRRGCVRDGP